MRACVCHSSECMCQLPAPVRASWGPGASRGKDTGGGGVEHAVATCSHMHARLCTCCRPHSPTAGQQLLYALGLTSDVPDPQQLLAWLEGRPRERCGIVITHAQELLSGPAEEQREFLQLIDNILHVSPPCMHTMHCHSHHDIAL